MAARKRTAPAKAVREYSTSLCSAVLPTIRPDTLVDRLEPRLPTPLNMSVRCPDQYGTAAKLTHAAKITPSSIGSPRSRHLRAITSPADATTMKNGVS